MEKTNQEGEAMATRADTNIMDFDEDDGLKHGHGKKANQKLKPYLVLHILMEHTDENHVLCADEIVSLLGSFTFFTLLVSSVAVYSSLCA